MGIHGRRLQLFAAGMAVVSSSAIPQRVFAVDECPTDRCVSFTCILPAGEDHSSNCGGGPFLVRSQETASVLVNSSKAWLEVTAKFYVYDAEGRQIAVKTVPAGAKPPLAIFTNNSDKDVRITFGVSADHFFKATITGSFWGVRYEKSKK